VGTGPLTRLACACGVACASLTALAQPQLVCGRESPSGQHWCINPAAVRENADGLRVASLYLGNDRIVHATGHVARANCQSQVLEFMSSAGRPFWSGRFDQSTIADRLGTALCY
jgi:hypothetical protein